MAAIDKFREMLEEVEDARPVGAFTKEEFIGWLTDLAFARALTRDYSGAMTAARDALDIQPAHSLLHVNLAEFLGRLNRFEEAAAEARAGLALAGGAGDMAELYYLCAAHSLATWEWVLGEKDHANELVENVKLPEDPMNRWMCRCQRCVYWAVTGEEEKLRREVEEAFALVPVCEELDAEHAAAFFVCDIVYDPFREKDWFIDRFGKNGR